MAACAVFFLLFHLLFAQLTLILAVAFAAVARVSRWRWWWLSVPVVAGLAWMLAIGPRDAVAGFTAGPDQILAYLGGAGGQPLGRLLHLHGAYANSGSWLPRQLPIALVAGSAEAALAGLLAWVHTDEWKIASPRPGAVAAVRSALNRRAIRAGAVLTRNGCSLGVAPATGARVVLSWQEAAGGVLVTGATTESVTVTSLQVVHAALRRRKPVITVDMSGGAAVGGALAAACAATGTPLRVSGTPDGCYEPFRYASPGRRLAMTLALLGIDDPDDRPGGVVRTCLNAAFELIDAVPADPRTAVLDDVAHLLNPQALQARFRLVPESYPERDQLQGLVAASVHAAQQDPQPLLAAIRQLAVVRQSLTGSGAATNGIDLARAVRERSAVLFSVDGRDAARLVCADIAGVGEDLCGIGVDGDGLVWLYGCDALPEHVLARLVADGSAAGLPVLITTTSPAAADLAGLVNAVLIHGLADRAAAVSLAARTGAKMVPATPATPTAVASPAAVAAPAGVATPGLPGGVPATRANVAAPAALAAGLEFVPHPAVPERTLLSLPAGQFVLVVNSPRSRLVQPGQAVPARLPRGGQA